MLNVTELTCRGIEGNSCAEGLQCTLNMLLFSIWSQTDGSGALLECCLFSLRLIFDLTSCPWLCAQIRPISRPSLPVILAVRTKLIENGPIDFSFLNVSSHSVWSQQQRRFALCLHSPAKMNSFSSQRPSFVVYVAHVWKMLVQLLSQGQTFGLGEILSSWHNK